MSPAELLFRAGVSCHLAWLDPVTGEPRQMKSAVDAANR
jgi:hypothetical protein